MKITPIKVENKIQATENHKKNDNNNVKLMF